MKRLMLTLTCVLALCGAGRLSAQKITVHPVPIDGPVQRIGDGQIWTQDLFYDNSDYLDNGQAHYFPMPQGKPPIEIADDIHFSGSYLVDRFEFAYGAPDMTIPPVGFTINFYDQVSSDFAPVGPPVKTLAIGGLPRGGVFVISAEFAEPFLWRSTTLDSADGGYVGLLFSDPSVGWIIASGGDSSDSFYAFQALNDGDVPPFFYDFNGNPPASFYLKIWGTRQ